MKRRDLLRAAAALPGFYVLGCSRAPAWFGEALARMRSEGKPGLVVRLPKDPEARCSFGHGLLGLMDSDRVESLEVARQCVLICLEDEALRSLIVGARDGDSLVLIDADGVAIEGRPISDAREIEEAGKALLDGPKLSRLRSRTGELASLVLRRREDNDWAAYEAIQALGRTPTPLPYGASIQAGASPKCAENKECVNGTCFACGLGAAPRASRQFVKFLVK